jgi:hypothetical protein
MLGIISSMQRHWILWKSLWLGVVLFGWLVWAWMESVYVHRNAVIKLDSGWGLCVGQGGGVVEILWNIEYFPPVSRQIGIFSMSRNDHRWLAPASFDFASGAEIPHWILVVIVVFFWSIWIAWRWRRENR